MRDSGYSHELIRSFSSRSFLKSLVAIVTAAATLGACYSWHTAEATPQVVKRAGGAIRVHVHDMDPMELYFASVVGDSLSGYKDSRHPETRVAFALADVRSVEVQRVSAGKTVVLLLTITATAALVGGAVALGSWGGPM